MILKRSGLYSAMGKRSSMGWIPVAFGLYSHSMIATSTPSPSMYSSRREDTKVPSWSYRSERGTSSPKCSAHSIQEGLSVGRRAACTCASTRRTPSSILSPFRGVRLDGTSRLLHAEHGLNGVTLLRVLGGLVDLVQGVGLDDPAHGLPGDEDIVHVQAEFGA